MGLSAARSGPLQGLSLGRGRHRGILRSLPDPVLVARTVERTRPDSERALLRRRSKRRKSRRGREGVLLLPRRRAEPRLSAHALQISAALFPVLTTRRRKPPARHLRSGV